MQDGLKRMTLQVDGITCAGCAEDMEKTLLEKDGVHDASVNYAEGRIEIEYDPGILNERDIFIAVRKMGFQTRIIGSSSA